MTDRVWNGGAGDWADSSRWTATGTGASGAPIPGDTARIASGDVDIVGAEGLDGSIYNGVALTLGDASNDAAMLDLSSAFLSNFFSIAAAGSAIIGAQGLSAIACRVSDATAGSTLTLEGGTSSSSGTLILARDASVSVGASADLDLRGSILAEAAITAAAGSTTINDGMVTTIGSLVNIGGTLSGTGTFDVAEASTLVLGGSVGNGQTISFGDVDGRVEIAQPAGFAGTITGFKSGDFIDFTTVAATAASFDAASQTLTLTDASGAAVATLSHVQAATGALTTTSDGNGGTTIAYAGAPTREQQQIDGADRAMRSDVVRATMTVPGTSTPITGAGVKVGIISGSFDVHKTADADAAAGYLPANPDGTSAVTILQEGAAGSSDEGREMADEIHQVAPGAQLYFASPNGSETGYETAVEDLQQAGCQIIASDISFPQSPFYQVASGLDASVTSAIAAGVNFFESGGNFGQAYVEQQFAPQDVSLSDGTSAQAQIFSNGTPYEPFTAQANAAVRLDLQWTAPFEGGGRGAPDALSFKVFTPGGQLVTSATGQTTSTATYADNLQTTDVTFKLPTASARTTYEVAVYLNGGQVSPQAFKITPSITSGTGTGPGGFFDDPQAGKGSGNEKGIQLVPGVNSVGASYFGNSAIFGNTPKYNEYFVNSGPGSLYYDSNGRALSTPESAGKLDFDAPDGVYVPNVQQSDPNTDPTAFFGTSSAVPNAAAVAALMLQVNPSLTTAQVTSLLEQSAIDQGLTAAQQGAGLIQADRAVSLAIAALSPAGSTTPTPGNDSVSGSSGNDTIAALAGKDTINGGSGNDLLLGNQGNDQITAGDGMNTVYGGMDNDRITAGNGNNLLYGNEGSDTIQVGNGMNTIVGGQDSTDGADLITSGSGNDLILGNGGVDTVGAGGGSDTVVGGYGRDILLGNQGDDFVLGNQGDDTLFGGQGNDTLVGGQGNDVLYGNEGDDVLYGNEGLNTFVFNPGDTDFKSGVSTGDTIADFATGTDRIDFASGPAGTATNFGSASTTSTEFASIQAAAQGLINGGDTYAFVSDGTDGFLFTTGGTGTSIADAVKLSGAGTATSLHYRDIGHGAIA